MCVLVGVWAFFRVYCTNLHPGQAQVLRSEWQNVSLKFLTWEVLNARPELYFILSDRYLASSLPVDPDPAPLSLSSYGLHVRYLASRLRYQRRLAVEPDTVSD